MKNDNKSKAKSLVNWLNAKADELEESNQQKGRNLPGKEKIILSFFLLIVFLGGFRWMDDRWKDLTVPGCNEARVSSESEIYRAKSLYPFEFYKKVEKEQNLIVDKACNKS
jgi:hypothetical protein